MGASGGAAEGADVVIGSDVDVGLGGAALVVAKCIVDEKVASYLILPKFRPFYYGTK